MRRDTVNYVAVGLFVSAAFLVLLVVLIRITGSGIERDHYLVRYTSVTGIVPGSVVTVSGYRVGQVSTIAPMRADGKSGFVVEISVTRGWRIPVDSIARIVSPGLLASYQIDIVEGESTQIVEPGGAIRGEPPVSLMASVNAVAGEASALTRDSVRPLIESLRSSVEVVGTDLEQRVPEITRGIVELVDELGATLGGWDAMVGDRQQQQVRQVIDNAEGLSRHLLGASRSLEQSSGRLERLLVRVDDLVAGNSEDLRGAVHDLRALMRVAAGSVTTIAHNLESTSRNLNEFSRRIRDNPAALVSGRPPRDAAGEVQ
ncbi:MAG: MlaD family protein [Pseudomonadota bacterium]|nr:MlaD family protein [Pseudomonadota bacterium]